MADARHHVRLHAPSTAATVERAAADGDRWRGRARRRRRPRPAPPRPAPAPTFEDVMRPLDEALAATTDGYGRSAFLGHVHTGPRRTRRGQRRRGAPGQVARRAAVPRGPVSRRCARSAETAEAAGLTWRAAAAARPLAPRVPARRPGTGRRRARGAARDCARGSWSSRSRSSATSASSATVSI